MSRRLLIVETEHAADLEVYRSALAAAVPELAVETAATAEEAIARSAACDAIAGKAQYLPAAAIGARALLAWVQALTTGVDPLVAMNLPKEIAVTSVRGVHGPQMAELVFLLMLALARDFPRMLSNQADAAWVRWPQPLLDGRTLLIVGVGVIGEAVAARAAAFGMVVIGASDGRATAPGFSTIRPYSALGEQAALADFVVVVSPYSERTHHLINAKILGLMRPDAMLINVSRGSVVDEAALLRALQADRIAGAALDVFAAEPLPADSPLWHAPRLIVTPHIGGMSDRYAHQVVPILVHNARAFVDGRMDDMVNRVNV